MHQFGKVNPVNDFLYKDRQDQFRGNNMHQDFKAIPFVDYDGYSISSKGFLSTVVDIMVI